MLSAKRRKVDASEIIRLDRRLRWQLKRKPNPEGYHTVRPYLVVDWAQEIIALMKDAFGANAQFGPMKRLDGKVMHAEMKIGDCGRDDFRQQ